MFKSDKNASKRSLLFTALIIILFCVFFLYVVYGSYAKYIENELNITTELFSSAATIGKTHVRDSFSRLTAEVNNAGQILSVIGTDSESISHCVSRQYEITQADVGLIFSSDGSVSYGEQRFLSLFYNTAKETFSSGGITVSKIIECSDGIKRFGIAAPFETYNGGCAVVMLLYPQTVLREILSTIEISDKSRLCIVDSRCKYIACQTATTPWIEEGKYSIDQQGALQNKLLLVKSNVASKEYYAYARSIGINDWIVACVAPKDLIDKRAQVGINQIRVFAIATLILVFLLLAISTFLNYFRVYRQQLFKEKFRIATSQSARAAFEYDKRTDRLTLISECEHISLPKPYISLAELGDLVHPVDRGLYGQAVIELRNSGTTSKTVRVSHFAGTGAYRWYNVTATRLTNRGEGKALTIGTVEDIDERENERIVLYERATTDSLTGLCNRAETEKIINERLINLEKDEHSAFALIDLDDFKNINDEFGHDFGDKALIFFSDKLRATFRFGDVIGRLGGDEFVVYMTLTSNQKVVEHRIQELMENLTMNRYNENNVSLKMTCSIGCCMAGKGDTFDVLYKRADNSLYESKTLGKGQATLC